MGELNKPIIIIDDGVYNGLFNLSDLEYNIKIDKSLYISEVANNNIYERHATTVAGIINKYSKNAKLGSIKILDNYKGTIDQLIVAVKWCVDNKIRLINLSLGTIAPKDFKKVYDVIGYAHENNVIIVASINNRNIYTSPASLKEVIGVCSDRNNILDENKYIFLDENLCGIDVIANSSHELMVEGGGVLKTSICNSYATPVITSIIYEIINSYSNISLYGVKQILKENSYNYKTDFKKLIQESSVEYVDVPIISIYDLHDNEHYYIKELHKLFRNNGYNSLSVIDGIKENKINEGIISYKEKRKLGLKDDLEFIRYLYNVFNFDVGVCCLNTVKSDLNIFIKEYSISIILLDDNIICTSDEIKLQGNQFNNVKVLYEYILKHFQVKQ